MPDAGQELIATHLQHLTNLKNNVVTTLSSGGQAFPQLQNDWNTTRSILTNTLLPKLGPAVELAARSMMALVTSCLAAYQTSEQVPQVASPFRSVWSGLILGQLQELETLLQKPPEIVASQAIATAAGLALGDLPQAKAILSDVSKEAEAGVNRVGSSAKWALILGIVAIAGASAVPFVWQPPAGTTGWALAMAWGTRVLAVAALLVGAIQLTNVFRDLIKRVAVASREVALLKVLAASIFLPSGREQAFVDLVRGLSQPEQDQAAKESLVLPGQLIKELPELVKLFKQGK